MLSNKNTNPEYSKSLELIEIVKNHPMEMGVKLHIYLRGLIPSLEEFPKTNQEMWLAFEDDIEQSYEWNPHYRIKWKNYDHDERQHEFYCIHLESGITIFKSDGYNKFQLMYDSECDQKIVDEIRDKIQKVHVKKSAHSIGMIQNSQGSLYVRFCGFNPYENDLIKYMGHEIQEFRQQLVLQLRKNKESGLYLLHGDPGTGKTSFLKQIIAEVKKKVLFISPSYVEQLTSPSLISLLLNYPDSILIIEDAETALMKRQPDNSNSVANLLNLTDGFPSDFLNLNIICTFNTDLEDIDPALLREGRLKGIQKFDKIDLGNAHQMARVVGIESDIKEPMTIAEICNPKVKNKKIHSTSMGFG